MSARPPVPSLTYSGWADRDWRPEPGGVVGVPGEPLLHSIHEVTAWMYGAELRVVLRGPMRKRDGSRGQHTRGMTVDLGQLQPDWLALLIRDARRRLAPSPDRERSASTGPKPVDGLTHPCPTPGYGGRHTAVGAGAISSPYLCHGCGTWFTLSDREGSDQP